MWLTFTRNIIPVHEHDALVLHQSYPDSTIVVEQRVSCLSN